MDYTKLNRQANHLWGRRKSLCNKYGYNFVDFTEPNLVVLLCPTKLNSASYYYVVHSIYLVI